MNSRSRTSMAGRRWETFVNLPIAAGNIKCTIIITVIVFVKLWDCKNPIVIFLIAYQTAFRCKIGLCHKGYVHACITGYTLFSDTQ